MRRPYPYILSATFCFVLLLLQCAPSNGPTLFRKIDGTGIDFINQLAENDSMNIMALEYFYRGGGVGIGDLNNDGLPDLILGGNMVPSRVYLNQGEWQFKDITEAAGLTAHRWINGISLVDINDDGLLDVYLCAGGSNNAEKRRNLFYINHGIDKNGIPSFIDQAAEYGLDSERATTQAGFLDYDRDGDLDVILVHTDPDNKNPNVVRDIRKDGSAPNTDQLFENRLNESNAPPYFADVSEEAGIRFEGFSLGLVISDINLDGWPDIYIANDHLSNDVFYINNRDGTFSNRIMDMLTSQSYYSMGATIKDLSGDGRNDIFTLDMLPERNDRRQRMIMAMSLNKFFLAEEYGYQNQFMKNTFQVNMGAPEDDLPVFSEVAQMNGIHNTDWSWGCIAADFDHNGHNDLIIANGYARDITDMDFVVYQKTASYFEKDHYSEEYRTALRNQPPIMLPNYAFRNNGRLQFEDVSHQWGLDEPNLSNGLAYGDLDSDGDLDLVINHINQPVSIYENTLLAPERHYVRIRPVDTSGSPALGAKVYVYSQGTTYYEELYPIQGYQSCQEPVLHFGLGDRSRLDSVLVHWPDGSLEKYAVQKTDRTYDLMKGRGTTVLTEDRTKEKETAIFTFTTDTLGWRHHPLTPYDDLYMDPLLLQTFSKESPLIAPADIDGNGQLDFYISSGPDQKGTLFLQTDPGVFEKRTFDKGGRFEDMDAAWLDVEQDGDLDLYVASGGVRHLKGHASLQDRLYINENDTFLLAENALPDLTTFTKSVVTVDFDQDGDQDVFVGGRTVFSGYPASPQSYLLENRMGVFIDASAACLPNQGALGMVAAAEKADLDQDGDPEIIFAGEWGPVSILEWTGSEYEDITPGFSHHSIHGWWQSIEIADINEDGFPDILLGNLGLNNPYSENLPLRLFDIDLDRNGERDPLAGWYLPDPTGNRKLFPVAMRDEITAQIPAIKTVYPTYADFSTTELENLLAFSEYSAEELEINTLESLLLLNDEGEDLIIHRLPSEAQWGPVCVFLPGDFNLDGQVDLICAGNRQDLHVGMSWNDAFMGTLLLGQNDHFNSIANASVNLYLNHQIRDGAWINDRQIVLSNYGGAPLLLTVQSTIPEKTME